MGYGDIPIYTKSEYILALFWMIVGVNFYSFIIGNVSSIIASMDAKTALLNRKLETLDNFVVKYKINKVTHKKIENFYEN